MRLTRSPTESFWFEFNESSFDARRISLTTLLASLFLSPADFPATSLPAGSIAIRKPWKLSWFLRDFGYDTELLGRDEVDETQLVGLKGVVKISHIVFNGASLLRLDGFAPADRWTELSPANLDSPQVT